MNKNSNESNKEENKITHENMLFDLTEIFKPIQETIKKFDFSKMLTPIQETIRQFDFSKIFDPINEIANNISKINLNIIFDKMENDIKNITDSVFKDLINNVKNFADSIKISNYIDTNITKENFKDNVVKITETISEEPVSTRKKRKWFERLFYILKKCGLTLIIFLISPLYNQLYEITPNQQIIYESLQEIEQIKNEEGITNELRVITKDTYIYKGKKLKQIIFKLQVGDIVEVLENNNKLLKVKEYQTGKIGWIRKKYTKC